MQYIYLHALIVGCTFNLHHWGQDVYEHRSYLNTICLCVLWCAFCQQLFLWRLCYLLWVSAEKLVLKISHLKLSRSRLTRKYHENFYTANLTTATVVHFPVKEFYNYSSNVCKWCLLIASRNRGPVSEGTPREDPGMSKGSSGQHGGLDTKGGSRDVQGILRTGWGPVSEGTPREDPRMS